MSFLHPSLADDSGDEFVHASTQTEVASVKQDRDANELFVLLHQGDVASSRCVLLRDRFLARAPCMHKEQRDHWSAALNEVWAQYLGVREDRDLAFLLGNLAARFFRFRQASFFFERSLNLWGENGATYYNLAVVHWQLAEHEAAQVYLARAIELQPARIFYQEQAQKLAHFAQLCSARLFSDHSQRSTDSPLSVSLLGPHHAQVLLRCQGDLDLTRLARVPTWKDMGEAQLWIRRQLLDPNVRPLALVHREEGVIGVSVLHVHRTTAHLCYFIGKDFRGQGLGRQAIQLSCDVASRLKVDEVFAIVDPTNEPSRRALGSVKFHHLPFSDQNALRYYHKRLGGPVTGSDASSTVRSLKELLRRVNPHTPSPKFMAETSPAADERAAC